MRLLRSLLLAFLALASAPSLAGTLYRCVGADGIPGYVSKRVRGAQCKAVANTSTPAAVASQAPAPNAVAVDSTQKPLRFLGMATSTTYSFVDGNGVTNYSSRRPAGVANVRVNRIEYPIFSMDGCYACALGSAVDFNSVRLNTSAFAAEIHGASTRYGVDEAIVRAVIHAESAFRANVRSVKGAQGLMQLIPATAARFGVADPYDPAQNISGGVQYLAWLMKRYDSNLNLVAAAYNAGEGAVDRNGGVPPYAETRVYVDRVARLAARYRKALAGS